MTSVRSHRLPLNGNSIIIVLCALLFIQCKTQRPVVKSPTENRPTAPTKVDTIVWTEPEDAEVIVIDETTDKPDVPTADELDAGKLGVILPLNANQMATVNGQIDRRDEALIQYYQGFLMGLKALDQQESPLHVIIRDSKGETENIQGILEEFKQRGVKYVFGSRGKENVLSIADFAKDNNMIYANAWQVNSAFVGENQQYVQLNPGLQVHLTTILQDALREFNPEQIILFGGQREKSRLDEINRIYQKMTGAADPLETMTVESLTDLEQLEMEEWKPEEDDEGNIIGDVETKVFIVPVTRNINLIQGFFRFLDFNAMHERSVVYGVTDWNKEILYDHLNNYDVRVTSFWNPRISQEFSPMADQFFTTNGTMPDEKAYEGYGHGLLIGNMIRAHADQGDLQKLKFEGGGMQVQLYDHNQLDNPQLDRSYQSSYFENGLVHLLGFEDFRYFVLPR